MDAPALDVPRRGEGSGFVVDPDGYILTNHHLVPGPGRIRVRFADRRELPARRVGSDPNTDLALIKVEAKGLPSLRMGDSDHLRVGDWVCAIGNPLEFDHTVTVGVVSSKGRKIWNQSFDSYIQTDAAINPGNSGGPLVNVEGEAVGINAAVSSEAQGIGFAVPINVARAVLGQLRDHGHVAARLPRHPAPRARPRPRPDDRPRRGARGAGGGRGRGRAGGEGGPAALGRDQGRLGRGGRGRGRPGAEDLGAAAGHGGEARGRPRRPAGHDRGPARRAGLGRRARRGQGEARGVADEEGRRAGPRGRHAAGGRAGRAESAPRPRRGGDPGGPGGRPGDGRPRRGRPGRRGQPPRPLPTPPPTAAWWERSRPGSRPGSPCTARASGRRS